MPYSGETNFQLNDHNRCSLRMRIVPGKELLPNTAHCPFAVLLGPYIRNYFFRRFSHQIPKMLLNHFQEHVKKDEHIICGR